MGGCGGGDCGLFPVAGHVLHAGGGDGVGGGGVEVLRYTACQNWLAAKTVSRRKARTGALFCCALGPLPPPPLYFFEHLV